MPINNIYYIIPDLIQRSFCPIRFSKELIKGNALTYIKNHLFKKEEPVGGIKISYQHCLILKELGYKAYPLLMGKYVGNFYGYDLEYKKYSEIKNDITSGDIVVSTEFKPYQGLLFDKAFKIIFVQNWGNVAERFFIKPSDKDKSYIDLGYDAVLSCSQYSTELIKNEMKIHAHTIINGIDLQAFVPDEKSRKKNRVLCLMRKNINEIEQVISILNDKNIEFKLLNKVSQQELIKEYQAADIFFSHSFPEGFSLTPLEAMACGCAVFGYTGGGASEFMIDNETALIAKDGDYKAAASQLIRLIDDSELKEKIRKNGNEIVKRFSIEKMKSDIKRFYELIEDTYF